MNLFWATHVSAGLSGACVEFIPRGFRALDGAKSFTGVEGRETRQGGLCMGFRVDVRLSTAPGKED